MTLDEAIQEFEFDCKIRHLSPKTIDNYKKQLRYSHAILVGSPFFGDVLCKKNEVFQ
jgi:hypothetical protein